MVCNSGMHRNGVASYETHPRLIRFNISNWFSKLWNPIHLMYARDLTITLHPHNSRVVAVLHI